MLPSAVRHGKSSKDWNTMPRPPALVPVTSLPFSRIAPLSQSSMPSMMRSSVDLPQPDGPRRTTNSRSSTASEKSCRTGSDSPCCRKLFETPRTSSFVAKSAQLLQRLLGDARVDELLQVRLLRERAHRLVRGQQLAELLALEVAVVGPGARGLRQQLPNRLQLLVAHLRRALDGRVLAVAV